MNETSNPNEPKTKMVHIGRTEFEIPSHMTLADMVECWRDDSESYEAAARDIVENNPRFAFKITSLWLDKHHRLLTDDPSYKRS